MNGVAEPASAVALEPRAIATDAVAVAEPPAERFARAPAPAAGRGCYRPVEASDLSKIVTLHRRVFAPLLPEATLRAQLADLLFDHPCGESGMPSWLYEEGGEVLACLGVLPRPMLFEGAPMTAALCHNVMVAPERRASPLALELLRRFLRGGQTLSFTFGNESMRRLWRAVGAGPAIPYSLRFAAVLRPGRYALGVAARRVLGARFTRGLGLDAAVGGLGTLVERAVEPWRRRSPAPRRGLEAAVLDAETLASAVAGAGRRRKLAPFYDAAVLSWLLERLERFAAPGALARVALRRGDEVRGWYLYKLRRDRVAEVIQVGAERGAEGEVLDHLRAEARSRGAVALEGQLDPAFLSACLDRSIIVFHGRGTPSLLLHGAEGPVRALRAGDGLLTRLEAEWWA
jgi:hypothetical protein